MRLKIKLLAAVLLGVWMIAPVMAADTQIKHMPPLSNASWVGPYAGLAFGGKWNDINWTTTSTSDLPGTIVDASSPAQFDAAAAQFGGYAGRNWQQKRWVYGVELDGAIANRETSRAGLPGCAIDCAGAPGPGVDQASVKMGWDASARARLGYLANSDTLIYGAGGVAWQHIETTGFCQHSLSDPQCTVAAGSPLDMQTNSTTLTGWTIGVGFEARLSGNLALRGEYRYADFGKMNGVFAFGAPGGIPGVDTYRYNLSVNTQVATIGLTYMFGGPTHMSP